jgi:hypothetical protein
MGAKYIRSMIKMRVQYNGDAQSYSDVVLLTPDGAGGVGRGEEFGDKSG